LLGEPGGPVGEVAEPLPWWKPRQGLPRGKPEVSGWLPIPLSRLVPFWLGSVVVIVLVGLTLPAWVQWLLPFVYFTLWIEVERRLGERVEAQLGPEETRRARGCDITHSPRRKWAALYVLVLVGQFFLVGAIYRSGWFNGHGIGVIFTLGLLLYVVERDLASRWRWRRLQTHVH
jgi:hypothetical protein